VRAERERREAARLRLRVRGLPRGADGGRGARVAAPGLKWVRVVFPPIPEEETEQHHAIVDACLPYLVCAPNTNLKVCYPQWEPRVGTPSGNPEWEPRVGTPSGNPEWEPRVGTPSGNPEWEQRGPKPPRQFPGALTTRKP
jgi:hypothetical protein